MKKSITEKAEIAISAINKAIAEMRCQTKIQRFDREVADKLIMLAKKKARAVHNDYFNRYPKNENLHLRGLKESDANGSINDFIKANDTFISVLKNYGDAVPFMNLKPTIKRKPKMLNP